MACGTIRTIHVAREADVAPLSFRGSMLRDSKVSRCHGLDGLTPLSRAMLCP